MSKQDHGALYNTTYGYDDRDLKSKRTYAILMILFSLTETGKNWSPERVDS